MGLLPQLDINVKATVSEFYAQLCDMTALLSEVRDLLRQIRDEHRKDVGCLTCDESGRLRCPKHGPVKVPGVGPVRLTEVPDDVDAEDMQPDVPQSYPVLWAAELRDNTDATHGPYGYTGPGGDSRIVTRWCGDWLVRDDVAEVWLPEPRIPTWPGLFSLTPPHERAKLSGPVADNGLSSRVVVF